MIAARSSACWAILALRSSRSISPWSPLVFTTTTRSPAMTALAAFVPWAEAGMRQTLRWSWPLARWILVDREQSGELALRAGVRLQRHRVVAGDLGEPALQVGEQLGVARELLGRGERVDVREAGIGHRLHLGGRVELHRAGAERDHAAVEGVVTVGELPQVAQHRRLGAVRVEDRVGEELRRPRHAELGVLIERVDVGAHAERGPDGREVLAAWSPRRTRCRRCRRRPAGG